MARGRMITNEITKDNKIHQLSDDTSRIAFTWLITFADCEGRTYGDPALVRSMLFPRRDDVSIEKMTAYIQEWADLELITWYDAKGDKWIAFPNFEKNQPGLRKDREPESNIPPPFPQDNIQQDAGNMPEEIPQNTGEIRVKRREEKRREPGAAVFRRYEECIGSITKAIQDRLEDAIGDYPEQWILDALGIAADNNAKSWNYAKAILERWDKEGRDSPKQDSSSKAAVEWQ